MLSTCRFCGKDKGNNTEFCSDICAIKYIDNQLKAELFNIKDNPSTNPLHVQYGGKHYKKCKIQPIEYIQANNLDYVQGNIIKYATRYKDKGGKEDLEKIKHYCDLAIMELDKNAKDAGQLD